MNIKKKIAQIMATIMCRHKSMRIYLLTNLAKNHAAPLIHETFHSCINEVCRIIFIEHTEYKDSLLQDILARPEYKDSLLKIYIREARLSAFQDMFAGKIKLQIGSGRVTYTGWLNTIGIDQLDITKEESWASLFLPGSVSNILAEHVFEHLSLEELRCSLEHVHKYLAPGGVMRIAVPDAFHPSRYYYNLVKPGGEETPYEHKIFLDYTIVTKLVDPELFDLKLIEYFDENGIFHAQDYDLEYGEIRRCARNNVGIDLNNKIVYDQFYSSIPEHLRGQFFEKNMTYTSLFFDIKKI